ncbi:MAG TPA: GMP/IMP nucleotidase [Gammaproteobacteria bacterium]|jgi:putative hydrolase of the HAD superfamily
MLNWRSIDTVLLDMDGTLLDLHFDNYFWQEHLIERYAELYGIPVPQSRARLGPRFEEIAGSLDWYCLDFWSRELNVNILELKREVEHLIAIHPYAEQFLQTLHGRKQLVLVTNAHPASLTLKLERTGIHVYFGTIFSAHQFRHPKESSGFWPKLHEILKFDPTRTLLVEDNVSVLRAAREFGIQHLLAITRPDSKGHPLSVEGFTAIEHFGELLPISFDE